MTCVVRFPSSSPQPYRSVSTRVPLLFHFSLHSSPLAVQLRCIFFVYFVFSAVLSIFTPLYWFAFFHPCTSSLGRGEPLRQGGALLLRAGKFSLFSLRLFCSIFPMVCPIFFCPKHEQTDRCVASHGRSCAQKKNRKNLDPLQTRGDTYEAASLPGYFYSTSPKITDYKQIPVKMKNGAAYFSRKNEMAT